jgi:probable rRNA maturation factor
MNEFSIADNNLYLDYPYLKDLIEHTLAKLKVKNSCFSIIFISDEEMKKLNKEYRGINNTTDVVSFALNDNGKLDGPINLLGDIYISIPKMIAQAKEYNHSEKRELSFLVIHGLLHLLGYNHDHNEDEKKMFDLQKEILNEKKIIS